MEGLIRSHPVDGEIIYTCMQKYRSHKKLPWLRNTRSICCTCMHMSHRVKRPWDWRHIVGTFIKIKHIINNLPWYRAPALGADIFILSLQSSQGVHVCRLACRNLTCRGSLQSRAVDSLEMGKHRADLWYLLCCFPANRVFCFDGLGSVSLDE